MTQLGHILKRLETDRASNRPHTADSEEISGQFYGLVKHGNASSTTLPAAFSTAPAAVQHAQLIADGLNAADDHEAAESVNES